MLQPVGPLPPSVYWRRRAVACVGLVLVAVLLIWGIAAASSGSTPDPTAAPGSASAAPTPTPSPAALAAPAGLATPPGGTSGVLDPQPGTALGPTAPGAGTAAPAPAPAARAAAPPGPCPDDAIRVTARTDRPRYDPGSTPVLSLVVTNVGSAPCVRDLDAARQDVAVVRRPGDGLWSSNDCSPGSTDDVRALAPGQDVVFSVRWSGRTSAPGCSGTRRAVPPGTYQLLARLDSMISDPTPFALAS